MTALRALTATLACGFALLAFVGLAIELGARLEGWMDRREQ